jgi:hypothetical protein
MRGDEKASKAIVSADEKTSKLIAVKRIRTRHRRRTNPPAACSSGGRSCARWQAWRTPRGPQRRDSGDDDERRRAESGEPNGEGRDAVDRRCESNDAERKGVVKTTAGRSGRSRGRYLGVKKGEAEAGFEEEAHGYGEREAGRTYKQ